MLCRVIIGFVIGCFISCGISILFNLPPSAGSGIGLLSGFICTTIAINI